MKRTFEAVALPTLDRRNEPVAAFSVRSTPAIGARVMDTRFVDRMPTRHDVIAAWVICLVFAVLMLGVAQNSRHEGDASVTAAALATRSPIQSAALPTGAARANPDERLGLLLAGHDGKSDPRLLFPPRNG